MGRILLVKLSNKGIDEDWGTLCLEFDDNSVTIFNRKEENLYK